VAQLDFYANSDDILAVIDFMFELAPMKLFEAYSLIDNEIREFKSTSEIKNSTHIDDNHGGIFVRGWWQTVTSKPFVKKIELNPAVGKYRYSLEGVGMFQLIQGRPHKSAENSLDISSFTHWNEKGALERAPYSENDVMEVNWKEFQSLSGKLQRYVRNKIPSARLLKRPILHGAFAYLEAGGKLFGQPGVYSITSREIEKIES